MRESDIQRAILDYLQAKGVLAYRMNTGMALSSYKGKTRAIRYGTPGMADVVAFPRRECGLSSIDGLCARVAIVWIECKAPGGKQSDLQKSFQQQVERHGHRYIVARSIEDVSEVL